MYNAEGIGEYNNVLFGLNKSFLLLHIHQLFTTPIEKARIM